MGISYITVPAFPSCSYLCYAPLHRDPSPQNTEHVLGICLGEATVYFHIISLFYLPFLNDSNLSVTFHT